MASRKPGKSKKRWETIQCKRFDGDILITDPCYFRSEEFDGWKGWVSSCGMWSTTFYGDWGCTVFRTGKELGASLGGCRPIGEFCADAGLVCVVPMKDAVLHCPDWEEWLAEHHWCGAVIKNFKGTVKMAKLDTGRWPVELRIRGEGWVDGKAGRERLTFESAQTSL